MTDAELRDLARGVTRETLHGPVPMTSVANLAMGVLLLLERLETAEKLCDEARAVLAITARVERDTTEARTIAAVVACLREYADEGPVREIEAGGWRRYLELK